MKRIYIISREDLKEKRFSEAKKTVTGVKNKNRDVVLIAKILKNNIL